jgi:hypothetical protein
MPVDHCTRGIFDQKKLDDPFRRKPNLPGHFPDQPPKVFRDRAAPAQGPVLKAPVVAVVQCPAFRLEPVEMEGLESGAHYMTDQFLLLFRGYEFRGVGEPGGQGWWEVKKRKHVEV